VYSHLRPSARRINDKINNGKLKLLNYICYMGRIALSPSIHTNMVASIRGRSVLSNKAFRVDRTSAVLYARTAVRAYVYSACQPCGRCAVSEILQYPRYCTPSAGQLSVRTCTARVSRGRNQFCCAFFRFFELPVRSNRKCIRISAFVSGRC
jgi:hypothetical protein